MFLLASGGHIGTTPEDLAYELLHRPGSWRGFLYIYLLTFPRFWTFCIELVRIFIFDGVTAKTQVLNLLTWADTWGKCIQNRHPATASIVKSDD